jgi:hypothetical protein
MRRCLDPGNRLMGGGLARLRNDCGLALGCLRNTLRTSVRDLASRTADARELMGSLARAGSAESDGRTEGGSRSVGNSLTTS